MVAVGLRERRRSRGRERERGEEIREDKEDRKSRGGREGQTRARKHTHTTRCCDSVTRGAEEATRTGRENGETIKRRGLCEKTERKRQDKQHYVFQNGHTCAHNDIALALARRFTLQISLHGREPDIISGQSSLSRIDL